MNHQTAAKENVVTLPTDLTPPIVQKKTKIQAKSRQRARSHLMACVSSSMPSDIARTSCLHHCQPLSSSILGEKWYDKITNANAAIKKTTGLTDLPSLIADRRHSLFGHICRLSRDTPASQALHLSIDAFTDTPPAVDWKRPPGRPRRT